jgi:hypothetical protein
MTWLNVNDTWCEGLFAMAQEFGDHPDAAGSRMRWVRQLAQLAEGGR